MSGFARNSAGWLRAGGFAGGAAPAVWTPSDVEGLILELDNQLITHAAGLVTAWPDVSGAGNHGAQSNPALQGDYEATGWDGAQPSVLLAGATSQEHLTFDAGTLAAALSGDDQPYTINLPCQVTAVPAGANRYMVSAGNSGTDSPYIALGASSTPAYRFAQADNAATTSAAQSVVVTDANRHQLTWHFNGTTRTMYLDGVSIATDANALGACTYNRFTLGILRRTGLGNGVNFRTPGMQVYSAALSAPELALLWQYNRDHFGGLP